MICYFISGRNKWFFGTICCLRGLTNDS